MKFSKALDETLKEFGISAKEISATSCVAESTISRFRRNDRDIQAQSLERILGALPEPAKQYFYIKCLLQDLNADGIALLLYSISIKLREDSKNSHVAEKIAVAL